jgi:CRP-like cAMP-binding protein
MFENMDMSEIDNFLSSVNSHVREYKKGECVIHRGDNLEYIYIVLDGILHTYTTYSDGNCILICNYTSGNVFGEVSMLTNPKYYQFEINAKNKSRLLLIDHSFLDDDNQNLMQITTNLMKCLASRASFLNSRMTLLALKTPLMKTAKYILENEKDEIANLPYNRIDSAEYLNLSRPTLSKELIRLKNMGIIEFNGNHVPFWTKDA